MDSIRRSHEISSLEEFLEELILQIDEPEQIDVLLDILKEIRSASARPAAAGIQRHAKGDARVERYDIVKKYPHRIARIGFVKGAENARRMLPGLRSLGSSVYFLHQARGPVRYSTPHA